MPRSLPAAKRPFLDEVGADPSRLRIAITDRPGNGARVDPDCASALGEAARLLEGLGHHVEHADPGVDGDLAWATFLTLVAVNMAVGIGSHPTKHRWPEPAEMEKVTLATAEIGRRVGAEDYVRAVQTAHRIGRQMAQFHSRYDLLMTPALATPPVKLGWLDMMMDDVDEYWRRIGEFTPWSVWFNITGQPAMTLPMGQTASGLPLSVQLVGRYADDATVFQVAAQIEAAKPWAEMRPLAA